MSYFNNWLFIFLLEHIYNIFSNLTQSLVHAVLEMSKKVFVKP